jgi:hypothetical protein
MLDALYPPRASIFSPSDDTIVCRCEELTAGDIRKAMAIASPGPNQLRLSHVRAWGRAKVGNVVTPSQTLSRANRNGRFRKWVFTESVHQSNR